VFDTYKLSDTLPVIDKERFAAMIRNEDPLIREEDIDLLFDKIDKDKQNQFTFSNFTDWFKV